MPDSADAMQMYREMLKLDPRSPVFVLLAEELSAAGKWEETAEVCRKGLQYHPDHLRARTLLGSALMELGDVEESEKVLLEVEGEFRKNSVIFKMLSEFAAFSGDSGRSEELARIHEAFEGTAASEPGAGTVPPPVPKAEEPEAEPDMAAGQARMEAILSGLADSIASRFDGQDDPAGFLNDSDMDYLRQTVLAELMAIA